MGSVIALAMIGGGRTCSDTFSVQTVWYGIFRASVTKERSIYPRPGCTLNWTGTMGNRGR